MRIVIELKREANPQVVLNNLFASTQLQTTFAMIMLALVNNQKQPKILSLRDILDEYIAFQKQVIVRRTEYELRKAGERAHLLEGLRIAVDNIDEVISLIRSSYSDAKERLMERFALSELQAQAILEMQLRRLQGLEREKIEKEYGELLEKIRYYNGILASDELVRELLIGELTEIRDRFGDGRKTEIAVVEDEIDIEDLIDEEDCVYTLTHAGYIKRVPVSTYKAQRRGGKGIFAMATREEDYVDTIFTASTHDDILFFTNYGRVYAKRATFTRSRQDRQGHEYHKHSAHRTGRAGRRHAPYQGVPGGQVSRHGHKGGTVKRLRVSELRNMKSMGIRALSLDEGDELIAVRETDGNQKIIIATHDGMAICFNETDVRPMGRAAAGVRGYCSARATIA
jgi:DNA gyrase subunit A